MPLASGTRLGPYEILAPVGAGGMGEVYKARDTRLDRQVAIKIRRADATGIPEARARFEREARAISSLSHPNICALHDVGTAGDQDYLVMEWLDGETLASRISRGAIEPGQAIAWARQIADALAAAHRRGIVHRDLKPANVMITGSGVKLVDFGLARAAAPGAVDSASAATMTGEVALTAAGTWLGTAPYMAPEQIEGRTADARSDIFAFGAVLFEMLAGRRAFEGKSASAIAAAILHHEPPSISSVAPAVPPPLDRLIHECLAKDPDHRWQSAQDIALQLAAISEASSGRGAAAPGPRNRWLPWAIAAIGLLAAVTLWLRGAPQSAIAARMEVHVVPPEQRTFIYTFDTVNFAASPDGQQLAFVATNLTLWRRSLTSTDARQLTDTTGVTAPFWSPDGKSIGFFTNGELQRLDASSGAAVTIAKVKRNLGYSASWSTTGEILFSGVEGDAIYRVPAAGGEPAIELTPQAANNEVRVNFPAFLPDGQHFLFVTRLRDGVSWLMFTAKGQQPRRVMPIESNVAYVDPGFVVFEQGGGLVAQPFDAVSGTVSGQPQALAPAVRFFASTAVATFSASRSGTLVYQAQRDRSRLAWFDRTGHEVGQVGSAGEYYQLRLTDDGRSAFVTRALPKTGTQDVWSVDLDRNTETRLTLDDMMTESAAVPIGGGDFIAGVPRTGPPRLERFSPGQLKGEPLIPGSAFQVAQDVTPDSRLFAYAERTASGVFNLFLLPLDGSGKPTPIRQTPFNETGLRFSPDGRYYTITSDEAGQPDIYISPVSGGGRTPLSRGGAEMAARWSRDSHEIVYVANGRMMSVPVSTSPELKLGTPSTLFVLPARPWLGFDVAPDGKRFLAIVLESIADEQPLNAILNGIPPR